MLAGLRSLKLQTFQVKMNKRDNDLIPIDTEAKKMLLRNRFKVAAASLSPCTKEDLLEDAQSRPWHSLHSRQEISLDWKTGEHCSSTLPPSRTSNQQGLRSVKRHDVFWQDFSTVTALCSLPINRRDPSGYTRQFLQFPKTHVPSKPLYWNQAGALCQRDGFSSPTTQGSLIKEKRVARDYSII